MGKKYTPSIFDDSSVKHVGGSITFGTTIRPKNRATNRTMDLKAQATQRIIALMQYGDSADRLARRGKPISSEQEKMAIESHNNLAKSPKLVQFAYYRGIRLSLTGELEKLRASENRKKIALFENVIETQIKLVEGIMRELFAEIKREPRVISREFKKG
jgi:hypothetical protein